MTFDEQWERLGREFDEIRHDTERRADRLFGRSNALVEPLTLVVSGRPADVAAQSLGFVLGDVARAERGLLPGETDRELMMAAHHYVATQMGCPKEQTRAERAQFLHFLSYCVLFAAVMLDSPDLKS